MKNAGSYFRSSDWIFVLLGFDITLDFVFSSDLILFLSQRSCKRSQLPPFRWMF